MNFKFPIKQCDISPEDHKSLESFKSLLSKWHNWMAEDECSISSEIIGMVTQDVTFRIINHSRKICEDSPREGIGHNGLVANLIDVGYVTYMTATIRRLLDDTSSTRSLRKLVQDLEKNQSVLTRENYVCYDGLPYETKILHQQLREYRHDPSAPEPEFGENAVYRADRRHEHFDRLCGKSYGNRNRKDKVLKRYISKLLEELDKCKDIKDYADHFVAHISNPERKKKLTEKQRSLTLKSIEEHLIILTKVASAVHGPILNIRTMGRPLPTPNYDVFNKFEYPWIHLDDMEQLRNYWLELEKEREDWYTWGWPLQPD